MTELFKDSLSIFTKIGYNANFNSLFEQKVRSSTSVDDPNISIYIDPASGSIYYNEKFINENSSRCLVKCFLDYIYNKSNDSYKEIWNRKLISADKRCIDNIQRKLFSGVTDFKSIVESYQGAVDRLTALHVCNALIANGVSTRSAASININSYGATEDFCSGKTRMSLLPLVSCYCTGACIDSYSDVILNSIFIEKSTFLAVKSIILELTF